MGGHRHHTATYAAGHIAHFKIPRYLPVTDDFPMTVTGKIQKYKLRELSIDLLGAGTVTR
jgi:fatty-acyl-CoA synthase